MEENVIFEISDETTARGIRKKLKNLYTKKTLTNRLILLRIFFTYKMNADVSITSHLNVFDDLSLKMKSVDLKIVEEKKTMLLPCLLPQ